MSNSNTTTNIRPTWLAEVNQSSCSKVHLMHLNQVKCDKAVLEAAKRVNALKNSERNGGQVVRILDFRRITAWPCDTDFTPPPTLVDRPCDTDLTPPPALAARTTTKSPCWCTRQSTIWHQITSPTTAYQAAPINNLAPDYSTSYCISSSTNQQSGTRLHHQLLHIKQHHSASFHNPICR